MTAALRYLLGIPPDAIPFEVSDRVPLYRTYPPTGAVMASSGAMVVGGRLYVHPERLAQLRAGLRNPQPPRAEFDRWADDGGRP